MTTMLTKEEFIDAVVDDWFRETNQPFMVDQDMMKRIVEDVAIKFARNNVTPKIKETALNLLNAQIDDMGIYPRSFCVPKGSEYKGYEKRTEKMEGWNEALIEIIRRLALIETSKEERK
jgi:hypothetical protein